MMRHVIQIIAVVVPVDPPRLLGHARPQLRGKVTQRLLVTQEHHGRGLAGLLDDGDEVPMAVASKQNHIPP